MAASIHHHHRLWLPPSSKETPPDSWPLSQPADASRAVSSTLPTTDLATIGNRSSILDLMISPSFPAPHFHPRPPSHPSPLPALLPPLNHPPFPPSPQIDGDDPSIKTGVAVTLDLLRCLQPSTSSSDSTIELDSGSPPPCGWEKCLDLKTGNIYYVNKSSGVDSSDPGKTFLKSKADFNWSSSPSTSELTVEASRDSKVSMSPLALGTSFKANTNVISESGNLDLNLHLHLGLRSTMGFSSKSRPTEDNTCLKSFHSPILVANNAPARVAKVSAMSSSTSSTSSAASPKETASHNQDNNAVHAFRIHDLFKSNEDKLTSSYQSFTKEGKRKFESPNRYGCLLTKSEPVQGGERVKVAEEESMITVGCGNCLMFVMLSRSNSKCPRCGTCLLLDPQPTIAKRPKLGFSL